MPGWSYVETNDSSRIGLTRGPMSARDFNGLPDSQPDRRPHPQRESSSAFRTGCPSGRAGYLIGCGFSKTAPACLDCAEDVRSRPYPRWGRNAPARALGALHYGAYERNTIGNSLVPKGARGPCLRQRAHGYESGERGGDAERRQPWRSRRPSFRNWERANLHEPNGESLHGPTASPPQVSICRSSPCWNLKQASC